MIHLLKAEVQQIKITGRKVEYEESLTLDREMMKELGVMEYEQVRVNSKYSKGRIITYLLEGEKGLCELNGGAAQHFRTGEVVHLLFYGIVPFYKKPIVL